MRYHLSKIRQRTRRKSRAEVRHTLLVTVTLLSQVHDQLPTDTET